MKYTISQNWIYTQSSGNVWTRGPGAARVWGLVADSEFAIRKQPGSRVYVSWSQKGGSSEDTT